MILDPNTQLESETVLLRPTTKEDYSDFSAIAFDPAIWKYFCGLISSDAELKDFLTNCVDDIANGNRLAFTIVDKLSGSVAGSTSFGNYSNRDSRVEIGWTWLGVPYQGKGINTSVKYLLLRHAFEKCGLERVEFKTDVLNVAARKALKKIGATEEGVLRSHTLMPGNRRRDTIYYSILRPEWNVVKQRLESIPP